jgi:hypothetical protein
MTQRGHVILGEPEQLGEVLAWCRGGLLLSYGLDLEQRDFGLFGVAFFCRRLSNLVHHLGKRTSDLEPLSATLQLLTKGLPIGFTEVERLTALTGVGAAFVARVGGFELAIGAQELAFDEAKMREEVHCHIGDLVDEGWPYDTTSSPMR